MGGIETTVRWVLFTLLCLLVNTAIFMKLISLARKMAVSNSAKRGNFRGTGFGTKWNPFVMLLIGSALLAS